MPENEQEIHNRLRVHVDALMQLARIVNEPLSTSNILKKALELISQTLRANKSHLYIFNPATSSYELFLDFSFKPTETGTQPEIGVEIYSESDLKSLTLITTPNGGTILALPLSTRFEMFGIVLLEYEKDSHPDKSEEELASAFSIMLTGFFEKIELKKRLDTASRQQAAYLEAGFEALIKLDRDFVITGFNSGAEQLTGWKKDEAIGQDCHAILHYKENTSNISLCLECPFKQAIELNSPVQRHEIVLTTRDGDQRWVSIGANFYTDERGDVHGGYIVLRDIHRNKLRDVELKQQIRQLESLQGVIDAISGLSSIDEIYRRALFEVGNSIRFDLGTIHSFNPDTQGLSLTILYEPDQELTTTDNNPVNETEISDNIYELFPDLPAEMCSGMRNNEAHVAMGLTGYDFCQVLHSVKGLQSEICVPIKTQENVYGVMHLSSKTQFAFDGSDVTLAIGVSKQIAIAAERARLFEEVQQLARTDSLTGLYNKLEFWERLEKEMRRAERQRRPLSLVMIDLDRLKWFNDFYGHSGGDMLLEKIGELIRNNCRAGDTPFRYGGDEICLLLADTTAEEARVMAERIRVAAHEIIISVNDEDMVIGAEAIVTISVGIASFPADAQSAEQLFEYADAAMFRAKETGKDRVCVFDTEVDKFKQSYRLRREATMYIDDRLALPESLRNITTLENSTSSDTIKKTRRGSTGGLGVSGMEEVDLNS
jgi:diguanylate cyclase (GGDEF)-like protein/PAS domain S-box-containing protein